MRKIRFTNGEFYHAYNRGVEKRTIFTQESDFDRFIQSMQEFNSIEPIDSIYACSFGDEKRKRRRLPLVNLICYCLNPNHYHLMMEQLVDGGISEFMKRLGGGYTNYFNNKYNRAGVLFQGKFKANHINSNEYLLHVSTYINLNNRVHRIPNDVSKSSWGEYCNSGKMEICKKDIILSQFKNRTEYKNFAESSLQDILERKQRRKELAQMLLE